LEQLALAVAKEKGETLAAAAEEGEIEDEGNWSDAAILKLEEAMVRYYTSAFFHFHRRAAVVPLRLQRNIATKTLLAARCDKDCGVSIKRYVIRIQHHSSSRGEGTVE
jgi:hypothetical protein